MLLLVCASEGNSNISTREKCSPSLILKERQSETARRCQLTPLRAAVRRQAGAHTHHCRQDIEDVERRGPSWLLSGKEKQFNPDGKLHRVSPINYC